MALKMEWAGSGVAGARDVPVGGEVILGGDFFWQYFYYGILILIYSLCYLCFAKLLLNIRKLYCKST